VALSLAPASGCGFFPESQPKQAGDAISITKQPVIIATHTFEPSAPPPEMPALGESEQAECASDFISNASVSTRSLKLDATHATMTVTRVQMTLQLRINIWVPQGVTQHVMDHEEGHRQISEHYYENAETIARQIATSYLGRQISVSGSDLSAELDKTLQKLSSDVTAEYSRKVSPEAVQLRFDSLTDHARNDMAASDAVTQALGTKQ
jgi:hypothetical protein